MLVASLGGPAQSGTRRVEKGSYTGGGIAGVIGVSGTGQADFGAVRFDGGRERFVSVTVTDSSGRPVVAEVAQLTNGNQTQILSSMLCGETDRPVKVNPGMHVYVYVYYGQGCGGEAVSAPTSGTITAVFTRS
jgi:hypothetical protein